MLLATPVVATAAESADTVAAGAWAFGLESPEATRTGAVATADGETITLQPTQSLSEALAGQLAGYYNNGKVRGISSPNGSDPLIVFNGIPSPSMSLDDIDVRSVEAVSILKDAAAKALYGPRGAAGVVVITTKSGHRGPTRVNASANIGWQQPTTSYDTPDAYTYATLRNQALTNDGLAAKYSPQTLSSLLNGSGTDTDWTGKYLHTMRPEQTYNVEVAGGNDRMTFYVNAGYAHTGSLYKADWTEKYNPEYHRDRFSATSNIRVKMFPFLSAFANTNVNVIYTNQSKSGADNIVEMVMSTPATVEDCIEDGHVVADENFPNPIYGLINYSGVQESTTTNIHANLGFDLDLGFITRGLTARATVGYNSYYVGNRNGTYDYTRWIREPDGTLSKYGSHEDKPLSWGKSTSMRYFMNFQALLRWRRDFGVHGLDAFVSYLAEDRLGSGNSASWILPYKLIQLGGHVQYSYDGRYVAQLDFTHAGAEQMREGNQFHFSPTASLAWVVTRESFAKDIHWLDLLKLRVSYGELEYDALTSLPSRYLYSTDYREHSSSGPIKSIYSSALVTEGIQGNPDIEWERSCQQNYGIDVRVLGSLSLSVDYWVVNQKDVIYQDENAPELLGIPSGDQAYANIGHIRSQGIDVAASWSRRLACGLGMEIAGTFSWNKDKVLDGADLDYSALGYAYPTRRTGYPVGQKFGYLVDYSQGNGFYNSQAEIDASGLRYAGIAPRPGDLRYRDLNGDGLIDQRDMAPLAGVKKMPSCSYGLSGRFDWHNFDLYILLQAETGRSAFYDGLGVWDNLYQGVYTDDHLGAWTAERYAAGLPITYPALTSGESSSLQNNDYFTSKADYLRLKNVTIGYTLPRSLTRRMHIDTVHFYIAGYNLLTATNLRYDDIDPECSDMLPGVFRSYNFGINLKF